MKVKNQQHTETYSIYEGDCMDVLPEFEKECIKEQKMKL